MPEFQANIWAPWRMVYIRSLEEVLGDGCFLCRYWSEPARDQANRVLWRSERAFVVLNLFPYTNGHMLIAPAAHKAELAELDESESVELMRYTRDAMAVLREAVRAQGFNVGMNFGRCAGAGLPEHLHIHVVPRWEGDTNFMPVLGNAKVIPQSLDEVYAELRRAAQRLGLTPAGG